MLWYHICRYSLDYLIDTSMVLFKEQSAAPSINANSKHDFGIIPASFDRNIAEKECSTIRSEIPKCPAAKYPYLGDSISPCDGYGIVGFMLVWYEFISCNPAQCDAPRAMLTTLQYYTYVRQVCIFCLLLFGCLPSCPADKPNRRLIDGYFFCFL